MSPNKNSFGDESKKSGSPSKKFVSKSSAPDTTPISVNRVYRIAWDISPNQEGAPHSGDEDRIHIEGTSITASTKVNCVATLYWHTAQEVTFDCIYDTTRGVFSDFAWTRSFQWRNGNPEVPISMIIIRGISYKDIGAIAIGEKEVFDDEQNQYFSVVVILDGEAKKGMLHGKTAMNGTAFRDCGLLEDEKVLSL